MRARWLWRGGFVLVLSLIAGSAFVNIYRIVAGGAHDPSQPVSRSAPCLPGVEVPIQDSPHIAASDATAVQYNSVPPTSGPHYSFRTAPGIYDSPVPDGLTVHAMEHGHVVIHYAPRIRPEWLAALRKLAKRHAGDVILTPNPAVSGIALTAWGRLDQMAAYDEARASAFIRQLRGRYDHGWTRSSDCPVGP